MAMLIRSVHTKQGRPCQLLTSNESTSDGRRNPTSIMTNHRFAEEEEVFVGIVMDGGTENISVGGNVIGAAVEP